MNITSSTWIKPLSAPHRTVHKKGGKTVPIRVESLNSQRFSPAAAVLKDGIKLPLLVVFKNCLVAVLRGACRQCHLIKLFVLCRKNVEWIHQ